jgi:hypothetical protein
MKYFFVFLGITFIVLIFYLCKYTDQHTTIRAKNKNSQKPLHNALIKMLDHNRSLTERLYGLTKDSNRIVFWYSDKACPSCVETVFVDLMEVSNIIGRNNVIIITPNIPESSNDVQSLSYRYDSKLVFISGDQSCWDRYSSQLKGIYSIFFIISKSGIDNTYVYDIYNSDKNQMYYKQIIKLFSDSSISQRQKLF